MTERQKAVTEHDPRLEQAFALIRAVIADVDKLAQDRLIAQITEAAALAAPGEKATHER